MTLTPAMATRVWLLISALPLLAFGYSAWSALSFNPAPIATGDALLDAFLNIEENENSLLDYVYVGTTFGYEPLTRVGLSDEQLAGLEHRFGQDPRYWMLKFRLSEHKLTAEDVDKRMTYNDWKEQQIDAAISSGAVDGAILLEKLRRRQASWRDEADKAAGLKSPKSRDDHAAYYLAERKVLDARHGAEETALFTELIAAAPDEALPHYRYANTFAERGDYEHAIAELALGNAAPQDSAMIGFPFDWLLDDLSKGDSLSDKALAGALLEGADYRLDEPNYLRIKYPLKILVKEAVAHGDMPALNVLHRYACRLGEARGETDIQLLVALQLVRTVRKARIESNLLLTETQSNSLAALGIKTSTLQQSVKSFVSTSLQGQQGQLPVPQGNLLEQLEDMLSCGRCGSLRGLLARERDGVKTRSEMSGEIAAKFRELETYSY